MYSDDKYCGSKRDFMSSVCNTVFLSLSSVDISEVLKSHDQIFRRILLLQLKIQKIFCMYNKDNDIQMKSNLCIRNI